MTKPAQTRADSTGRLPSGVAGDPLGGVPHFSVIATDGAARAGVLRTAHGDVPTARVAFQAQAIDFLEKPFDDAQLRAAIETAFAIEERRIQRTHAQRSDAERLVKLTSREREVLHYAAKGLHAKEIAAALGISSRTVEVHKTRIMEKLGVRNVAELVRFALAAEASHERYR